jgi:hypothetical protein
MTCPDCNEWKPLERSGLCASCARAARKADKMINNFKVVKPVEKVSEKRAGELQEYAKLRKEYLLMFPVCEVDDCNLKSVEIHHQRGRENDRLLDTTYFLAVCHKHHVEIHDDTQKAKAKGYSETRSKTI